MLTSAHNRKKAEYFWPSVKWFPLKTVFFISSVKYSLYITHHRTLRRDTCISTEHFTAKRTGCCWHNQLSSGKVPMPGGRIISFPSRSRQTSVRRILLKRKHPVRNCPTALAYQPRSLMLKAKSFVPFMWPAMPVVNSAREVHHWPSIVRHRCFGSTALCTRLNIGLCLCPVVRHSWLSNFGQEFSFLFIQCQSDEKKLDQHYWTSKATPQCPCQKRSWHFP